MTLILSLRSIAIHLVVGVRSFLFTRHRLIQLKRHSYTQRTTFASVQLVTSLSVTWLCFSIGRGEWERQMLRSTHKYFYLFWHVLIQSMYLNVWFTLWMANHWNWIFGVSFANREEYFVYLNFLFLYNEKHWYFFFLIITKYYFQVKEYIVSVFKKKKCWMKRTNVYEIDSFYDSMNEENWIDRLTATFISNILWLNANKRNPFMAIDQHQYVLLRFVS